VDPLVSTAVYPGSFDPVTCGHVDIAERAARLFQRLIVAVAVNPQKVPTFTVEERMEFLRLACAHIPNVEVDCFQGLLVDYARQRGIRVVVKGLRVVSDFEMEMQMAHMNRLLEPTLETVFIMTATQYSFLSSSIVKEIAQLGGNIQGLVPDPIVDRVLRRLRPWP